SDAMTRSSDAGDHSGPMMLLVNFASGCGVPPVAGATQGCQSPVTLVANATREPSGDSVGAFARWTWKNCCIVGAGRTCGAALQPATSRTTVSRTAREHSARGGRAPVAENLASRAHDARDVS